MKPFLSFQGSRACFFSDLFTGDTCPSAFPSILSGLRFPPYPSREKNSALPPVSQERVSWSPRSGEFDEKTPQFSRQRCYGAKALIASCNYLANKDMASLHTEAPQVCPLTVHAAIRSCSCSQGDIRVKGKTISTLACSTPKQQPCPAPSC